jgi:hypothetical protein
MTSITLYYLFLNVFTIQDTLCSEEKKWPFVTLADYCRVGVWLQTTDIPEDAK